MTNTKVFLIILLVVIVIGIVILCCYFHPFLIELSSTQCMFVPRFQYTRKKIDIITLETRPLEMLYFHNISISHYAKLHNYSYRFYADHENKENLPVYWQKLLLVRDILSNTTAEYIVWMDSDTIVSHPTIALEELLILSPNSSIFIGRDYPNRSWSVYCAGIFIIRNCDIGKKFINECLSTYMKNPRCGKHELCGSWAGECYEQGVMNELLQSTYKKDMYEIPLSFLVNSYCLFQGSVLVHVYGPDKARTTKFFTRHIKSLSLEGDI